MDKFSTEFPSPTIPTMPEYFKKDTLAGLVPGEVIFPYAHVFKADAETGLLYVRTSDDVDSDAKQPSFFGERAGVMRVYGPVNGELVDGYIADFRHVKPGSIGVEMIHIPDNATAFDRTMAANAANNSRALLAAVFRDPDGNPHLVGDLSLAEHIETLMSLTDDAATKKPLVEQIPAAITDARFTEPGYYHG